MELRLYLKKNGAEIVATENIGIKELAYEIEKCKRGYYYVIYFKAPKIQSQRLKEIIETMKSLLDLCLLNMKLKRDFFMD